MGKHTRARDGWREWDIYDTTWHGQEQALGLETGIAERIGDGLGESYSGHILRVCGFV